MADMPAFPMAWLAGRSAFVPPAKALVVYILNVGDGDAIIIQFPEEDGEREYAVVDSNNGAKTINLLKGLGAQRLRFICATHPHLDHIRGLRAILRAFSTEEYWDSGFLYTSKTYNAVITQVEHHAVQLIRPTSGFQTFIGGVRLTVLSPSIMLRNRYDTYGVNPNNASIVLRLEYPRPAPSRDFPVAIGATRPTEIKSMAVVLGGDAQTDAWSRVLEEFPHLEKDQRNWVRQIQIRKGKQPLACDVLKVSHHASKHGINLELVERMGDRSGQGSSKGPRYMISSCGGQSTHGFPHTVAQAIMREVRDPKAKTGGKHLPDHEMGLHYTAQEMDGTGKPPAGSIAVVLEANATTPDLYRFEDGPGDDVSFSKARKVLMKSRPNVP